MDTTSNKNLINNSISNWIYTNLIVVNAFIIFVSCFFVWVSLAKIGPLDFRLYHIFYISSLPLFLYRRFYDSMLLCLYQFRYLVGFYLLLNISFFVSLFWAPSVALGSVYVIKSISYFIVFFILTGLLIELIKIGKGYLISKIAQFSIITFLLIGIYIFYAVGGTSIFFDLLRAITSGDLSVISYKYLPTIFKFNFVNATEIEDWSNSRNTLALAFTNILALSFIFNKRNTLFFWVFVLINILLLTFCLSRSGHIFLLLIIGITILSQIDFKIILLCSLVFIPILLYIILTNDILYSVFLSRYESSGDGRSIMNIMAIKELMSEHFFYGFGIGKKIVIWTGSYFKAYSLHNLIIGAWYSAGIIGFLFAILFVSNLVYTTFRYYLHFYKQKYLVQKLFSKNWPIIFVTPLFPLVRMMVAGNYGLPGILEWTSLSIFAACSISIKFYKNNYSIKLIK